MATKQQLSEGVAHKMPDDLRKALTSDKAILEKWESLTPLARNEWICWTINVKTDATREIHVHRVTSELLEGKRRPCCWMGCIHHTDKPMNPSQKWVTEKTKETQITRSPLVKNRQ